MALLVDILRLLRRSDLGTEYEVHKTETNVATSRSDLKLGCYWTGATLMAYYT